MIIYKEEYIESKRTFCPFCKSKETKKQYSSSTHGLKVQYLRCLKCEAVWEEVYKLIDINTIKERKLNKTKRN